MRVGTDTGGTFTDLVAADGSIVKVPSTPDDPGRAVASGLQQFDDTTVLTHGTTVATNALLERAGATVALVTNEGFADIIEIARQDRPALYDPFVDRPEPLVPRGLRFEVTGRLDAAGRELLPIQPGTMADLGAAPDSVAVCLLHSDLNPVHEQEVAEELLDRGLNPICSYQVSPEFREYERTVTTVINAYVQPKCSAYLAGLAPLADEVLIMTSAGGLRPVAEAAELPVRLLLSGPAGGVRAAAAIAVANDCPDAVSFDMGGTSTDVCLIVGGEPEAATMRDMAGFPVRVPSLDVHTIGAGGGSIAQLDPGGALVVGPRSAGARPGPACYGHGGTEPTVTDANLVAGRIDSGATFPGLGTLDPAAAAAALEGAGISAQGVIDVVNANMERALRSVTVERGVDPRSLALVAFGGAGPLHACDLADSLGMGTVIIPPRAGVFSAVGILGAPRQEDAVRSWVGEPDATGLEALASELVAEVRKRLPDATEIVVAYDCRYQGQSHEVTVAQLDDFHAEHERLNGYARTDAPIEVTAVRATATAGSPVDISHLPEVERGSVVGPAVLAEVDSTTWVPPGWTGVSGAAGALLLRRTA